MLSGTLRRRDMHDGSCACEILSLTLGHSCANPPPHSYDQSFTLDEKSLVVLDGLINPLFISIFFFPPPFFFFLFLLFSALFVSVLPPVLMPSPLALHSLYPPTPETFEHQKLNWFPAKLLLVAIVWAATESERLPGLLSAPQLHTAAELFFFSPYHEQQHARSLQAVVFTVCSV